VSDNRSIKLPIQRADNGASRAKISPAVSQFIPVQRCTPGCLARARQIPARYASPDDLASLVWRSLDRTRLQCDASVNRPPVVLERDHPPTRSSEDRHTRAGTIYPASVNSSRWPTQRAGMPAQISFTPQRRLQHTAFAPTRCRAPGKVLPCTAPWRRCQITSSSIMIALEFRALHRQVISPARVTPGKS